MTHTEAQLWGGAAYRDRSGVTDIADAIRIDPAVARHWTIETADTETTYVRLPNLSGRPWMAGDVILAVRNLLASGTSFVAILPAVGTFPLAAIDAGNIGVLRYAGGADWLISESAVNAGDSVVRAAALDFGPESAAASASDTAACVFYALISCDGGSPIFTYPGFVDGDDTQASLGQYVGRVVRITDTPDNCASANLSAYLVERREFIAGTSQSWVIVDDADVCSTTDDCGGAAAFSPESCTGAIGGCSPLSCVGAPLAVSTACAGPIVPCSDSLFYSALIAIDSDGIFDTKSDRDSAMAQIADPSLPCDCRIEYRARPIPGTPNTFACESRRVFCYSNGEVRECWGGSVGDISPDPLLWLGGRFACSCSG